MTLGVTDSVPHKVLHVLGSLDRGGVEMRLLEQLRHFSAMTEKHDAPQLHYCLLSGRAGALQREFEALGAVLHPLPMRHGMLPGFLALLKREHFTAVHSHVQNSSGFVLLLALVAGVPNRIAQFWSTGSGRVENLPFRLRKHLLSWMIAMSATKVIYVSQSVMREVGLQPLVSTRRSEVIYDGVDLSRLSHGLDEPAHWTSQRPLLLQVGRLDPEKNQQLSVRILAGLRAQFPSAQLVCLGRSIGGYADAVMRLANELDVADAVHLMGERDDVAAWLAAADLMVHPSLREGWPGVVMEATAVGLPVLGSSIGPMREMAGLFNSVSCVALTDPASVWINQAQAILNQPSHEDRRDTLRKATGGILDSTQTSTRYLDMWAQRA